MSKKRGLGKGLGALIPNIENNYVQDETANSETIDNGKVNNENEILTQISVNSIFPNPRQARINFDSEKLDELKESIKEHGVVQPIVVRPLPDNKFELIAGERRWRACKKLGLDYMPAIVKIYSDIEASAISLIENIQRDDLNSLEEAMAYKKLMDNFGLTQEAVSNKVGKSRSFIANMVRILSLPDEIKEMLNNNIITAGHAKALLALDEDDLKIQIAEKIVSSNLSVRETEKLIKDIQNKNETVKTNKLAKKGYFVDLENKLNDFFNTKVNIKVNKRGKGKIEIEYKNKNELMRILKLMDNDIEKSS